MNSLPGPALNAVSPLPAGYELRLKWGGEVLGTDSRVGAIWLSGSPAAGVVDRTSDRDLGVTLRGPRVQEFPDRFADGRKRISPTVLARVVVPRRVFTLITPDWLRCAVALESDADLARPVSRSRLTCWDPGDLSARLVVETDGVDPSGDAVRRLATGRLRVTAPPECITARQDWLLATVPLPPRRRSPAAHAGPRRQMVERKALQPSTDHARAAPSAPRRPRLPYHRPPGVLSRFPRHAEAVSSRNGL